MVTEWKNLRILGKGTYGVVYLAVLVAPQEVNGEVIAVKSSRPNMFHSLKTEESILQLFFGCKEIVQCFWSESTLENGHLTCNLLMEYAPYGSLRGLIKDIPLLESEARVYTRMLLRGLSRIHQAGVVHCDLKSDNILLFPSSENGARYQVKIADFGLSKTKGENFNADFWKIKFRGTPHYMSPESVMGQIDTPLDIWSLGCIVLEMITGLRPWWNIGSNDHIMFKLAFLKEAPKLHNGLSQDCKDFLSKCFVKDPTERWNATMLLNHPFLSTKYDMSKDYKDYLFNPSFISYDD